MTQITAATIENVAKRGGQYYIPDRIRISIEQCLVNDDGNAITSEYHRLLAEFQTHETKMEPALIDYEYNGDLTLDAYTACYLPRYMSIPSIALHDLVLHPFFSEYSRFVPCA